MRAQALHSEMPLWARPGYLLRRLHQIHYALFFEECAGFDITPVQYGLLTTLVAQSRSRPELVGRELGIDRTNVADVLAAWRAAVCSSGAAASRTGAWCWRA